MQIYVLLFNAGTDNEGIHTLSVGEQNIVLMFEEEDDATRYSLLLEAQDFMTPAVEAIEQAEVEEFCRGAQYECRLVPKGFVPQDEFDRLMIAPPQRNLEQTTWGNPEIEAGQSGSQASNSEASSSPASASSDELDDIRRRLEGLL